MPVQQAVAEVMATTIKALVAANTVHLITNRTIRLLVAVPTILLNRLATGKELHHRVTVIPTARRCLLVILLATHPKAFHSLANLTNHLTPVSLLVLLMVVSRMVKHLVSLRSLPSSGVTMVKRIPLIQAAVDVADIRATEVVLYATLILPRIINQLLCSHLMVIPHLQPQHFLDPPSLIMDLPTEDMVVAAMLTPAEELMG